MSRVAKRPKLSEFELKNLQSWIGNENQENRLKDRARIVLLSADGKSDLEIAKELRTRPNTIGKWRKRFIERGLSGLYDYPRPGKPKKYDDAETRKVILETLKDQVPNGELSWDGRMIAEKLGISTYKVWRILKSEGISLKRQHNWSVSTEHVFEKKPLEIVGLYLNPPENALVLSLGGQTNESRGIPEYVQTRNKRAVNYLKQVSVKKGAVNLISALEVAIDMVMSGSNGKRHRLQFIEFMGLMVGCFPEDRELFVILDKGYDHKKCETWLVLHPGFTFYYVQPSSNWIDMVETLFAMLVKKTGLGFGGQYFNELSVLINKFFETYDENVEPFVWRKTFNDIVSCSS